MVGVVYRHRQALPELLYGDPFAWRNILGKPFALSAATFFQTNIILLPRLLQSVVDDFALKDSGVVVDLYGGVGLFGLALAPVASKIIEIEIDEVGSQAARLTCERQGLSNVELLTGTAETLMPGISNAEVVIVDPPRSGLTPKVVDAIIRLQPRVILYVSCFAGSMAHDARLLAGAGYRIGPVSTFDFYPQTYHLELFAALERTT